MQSKSRLLSIRRLWRSPREFVARLRRLIVPQPLTAEDVDAVFARCNEMLRQGLRDRASTWPAGSPTRANLERMARLSDDALTEEIMSNAHPNPERIGCPSHDLLVLLARKERPIRDPAYEHFGKCSPCYIELLAVQRAAGLRPSPAADGHSV
jgi:hypothetical protein